MSILKKAMIVFAAVSALVIVIAAVGYFYITGRVKGQFFDSNGVNIHYTVEGEGPPVILIHGFAVNPDLNFRKPGVTKALSARFTVISLDLRGHGLSDKPHDPDQYGLEMAEDVIRLMDHLEIPRAHVAGYSLGGFIALKLAVTHPERLLTALPLGSGWETPEDKGFLDAIPELESALRQGRGVGPLAKSMGDDKKPPGFMHTFWVKLMTRFFNDSEALATMVRSFPVYAVAEEDVRNIQVPMLSVIGGEDPFLAGAEALNRTAPNHELVIIPGANHIRAPMAGEFKDAIMDFLDRASTVTAAAQTSETD